MKLILGLLLFCATPAFAAELNLNGGDTVTIQPNRTTTVTCGGTQSGGHHRCSEQVDGFKMVMAACEKTYGGGYCMSKHWPAFKTASPDCAYAGMAVCLESCQKTYGGGYCADKCQ